MATLGRRERIEPQNSTPLPRPAGAPHARGLAGVGDQHAVPARRRPQQRRGVRARTRSSPRAWCSSRCPPAWWPTPAAGARRTSSAPRRSCSRPCSISCCGTSRRRSGRGRSAPRSSASASPSSRARSRRGWWTRSHASGFERHARVGAREGRDRRGRRDARRLGRGRRARAGDQPRGAVSRPHDRAGRVVRGRARADARRRLRAPAQRAPAARDAAGCCDRRSGTGSASRPVRWLMLAAPFTGGVGFYAFYAMQPYLLELYGDERAYRRRGPRSCDRRRRADRRRPAGAPRSGACSAGAPRC